MFSIVLLLAFVGLLVFVIVYFNGKDKGERIDTPVAHESADCCGAHEVCERDNLQIVDAKIIYFDDEELDVLAGIAATDYTREQADSIAEVFYSMKESDVAAWLRSLQLRNIDLPSYLREEALMIVSERRSTT